MERLGIRTIIGLGFGFGGAKSARTTSRPERRRAPRRLEAVALDQLDWVQGGTRDELGADGAAATDADSAAAAAEAAPADEVAANAPAEESAPAPADETLARSSNDAEVASASSAADEVASAASEAPADPVEVVSSTDPDGITSTVTSWTEVDPQTGERFFSEITDDGRGNVTSGYTSPGGVVIGEYVGGEQAQIAELSDFGGRAEVDSFAHFGPDGSEIRVDGSGLRQADRADCFNVAATESLWEAHPEEMKSLVTPTAKEGVADVLTYDREGQPVHEYVQTDSIRSGAVAVGADPDMQTAYNATSLLYHPGKSGGSTGDAMERYGATVTNDYASSTVDRFTDEGGAAVIGTPEGLPDRPYNLHGWHAYIVKGTYTDVRDGREHVILKNPWGRDHPLPVPRAEVDDIFDGGSHGQMPKR